jgi:hypothetical protein
MLEKLDKIVKELELLRKSSLESQTASKYASLCDYLGVNPEDESLYDTGVHDFSYSKEFNKVDKLYRQKLIDNGLVVTPSPKPEVKTFKPFPSNKIYVPSTIKGLKLEIRRLFRKDRRSIPRDFNSLRRNQLYAIYFKLMGVAK